MIYLTANSNDSFHPVTIYYKSKNLDAFHESRGSVIFPPECNVLVLGFGFHHYKHEMDVKFIKKLLRLKTGIVYICDELPNNIVKHDNIIYVKTGFNWFTHMLIKNPEFFKAVFHNNTKDSKKHAEAFSKFHGYPIPVIQDAEKLKTVKTISKKIEGSQKVLIESFDGLGDILMTLPSAYTLHKQGWEVSYHVHSSKAAIFDNLDYVKEVNCRREDIPIHLYNKHIILTHKLSTYGLSFNQQHRIYSSAFLCGIAKEDLSIQKPTIILSDEEKEYADNLLKDYENTVGICWNAYGSNRSYFRDYTQQLIDMLAKRRLGRLGSSSRFTPILLGTEKFPFKNCVDLTGQTDIRQLFALINKLDYIITVDTGVLHVAGALDKPTIAIMGPIPAEWRCSTYEHCYPLTPKVKCYPCWDRQSVAPPERACNEQESYCLRTIHPRAVESLLLKLYRKYKKRESR